MARETKLEQTVIIAGWFWVLYVLKLWTVFLEQWWKTERYSIGHSGKRNKWRDLVTPVSVFRGTNMRIELKQRKNWSKWQEVLVLQGGLKNSLPPSSLEGISIVSARWSLLLQDESSPSWVYPQLRWRWWQTCPLRFHSSGTLDLALKRLRLFLCLQPK